MADKPTSLAAALAEFQANLPKIRKGETAEVETKTGRKYRYSYADLDDVSAVVLPAIAKLGLSFSARPTLRADGRFVLAYTLRHVGGECDAGEYPLPVDASAQEKGSAITYARRQALCAVTGVAPAGDDDDAAPAQRQRPQRHTTSSDDGGYSGSETRWDAAEQEVLFDGWSADIAKARTVEDLSAIGGTLKTMRRRGELSPVAYDRLVQLGAARRAELNGMPIGEKTRARLFALFGELGLGGDENRQARRDMGTQVLGRTVESMRTLTEPEGRQMVTALEQRRKGGAKP